MRPNVRPDAGDQAHLGGSAEPCKHPHGFNAAGCCFDCWAKIARSVTEYAADGAEPVAPPLLPCPFCGGAAHIESAVDDPGEWFVGCQGCNAILGPVFEDSPCADEDTPAPRVMLTNAWNRRALARAPQGDPPEPGALRAAYREIAEAACDLPIMGVMPADQYREPESGYVRSRRPTDPLPDAPPASVERFQLALHRLHVLVSAVPAPQGDAAPPDAAQKLTALLREMDETVHVNAEFAYPWKAAWLLAHGVSVGGASSSGSTP